MNEPTPISPTNFVSAVVIVRNQAALLPSFVAQLFATLSAHFSDYEAILVDDGSTDGTADTIDRLLESYDSLRVIRLSREFGSDVATTAGLDASIGDFAVVLLPDCDPPEAIPELVRLAQSGAEVVIGTCRVRAGESWLFRRARAAFFWLCRRFTRLQLPENASSLRLYSRTALNALTRIRQKTMHHRLLSCLVGFRTEVYEYRQSASHGNVRRKSLTRAVGEAVSIMVTNTTWPLRAVSCVGVAASLLNLVYMLYVLAVNLVKRQVAEGWTTLSLQNSLMFLLLFSTLVVIAEYLGHTLEESKDRPLYHVAEEKSSSTSLKDAGKRNVYHQSGPAADRRAA